MDEVLESHKINGKELKETNYLILCLEESDSFEVIKINKKGARDENICGIP